MMKMEEEGSGKRRGCAWLACDHWFHSNQCLKHAIRFEPEVYDLEGVCVSGHPCEYSETCGYEKVRSPIESPTAEERAAYKTRVRRDQIRRTIANIEDGLARLKSLLKEEGTK